MEFVHPRTANGFEVQIRRANQAIVKAFHGVRVLEPRVVYLKPMHEGPQLSWFETTGKVVAEHTARPRRWRSALRRLGGLGATQAH